MADRFLSASSLPAPPAGKVATFKNLAGGLNLWELDYRMDANESPNMKNLWWRDGLLACRDGQEYVSREKPGKGFCCFEKLFWGHMVMHIGDGLYAARPGAQMQPEKLCGDIPQIRGSFVRYQDALLYKTKGVFKKILWDGEKLTAQDVEAYVPITVINCTPEGSGDLYQPENRLSDKKTVWFTATRTSHSVMFSVENNFTKEFTFTAANEEKVASVEQVYVGTTLQDPAAYTVSEDNRTVKFASSVETGETVAIVYTVGVREYKLPVEEVDAIEEILVDDNAVTAYTADLAKGSITFAEAPPVQDPPVNNTVKMTYRKKNEAACKAIMDCCYACAYGGTGGAVLIFAGSEEQSNAYFWNGSHTAMDMGYFPVSYYNLAGDSLEPITGFGRQAGALIVFKEHAVGKCLLGSTTIDDRAFLSLDYTPINSVLGCDLPWTIQTVGNNLVWCNTYTGVCRLDDTNEAMENRVQKISRNILGSRERPGLLKAVQEAETVCSLEDGDRYWVAAGGKVYLWDHAISSAQKPSWFYFENVPAVCFCVADTLSEADDMSYTGARQLYHLNKDGQISRFVRSFRDYGGAIEKIYTFATQDFGDVERQKHIKKVILTTRSDTDTVIDLYYDTDHESRKDRTPIRSFSWHLLPRNLSFRCLEVRKFAHVAVRKPGCRYARCFSLRLHNAEPGCDMSVVSAQIFADFVIKER